MSIEDVIQSALQNIQSGNLRHAEHTLGEILKIQPQNVEVLHLLGILYYLSNNYDEAIRHIRKALQFDSNDTTNFHAFYILGDALQKQGAFDEANIYYQKALFLNPESAEVYCNLGNIYKHKGQIDEAIIHYEKAIQINPGLPESYYNLGEIASDKRQIGDAVTYYQKAIQLNPDYAEAHFALAREFLVSGKFKEGWKEYEWRWKLEGVSQPDFLQPLWDGSDINGLTVFLHAEQGFGDTIQFIRYAPLIAQRGAKVIVACQPSLTSLLKNVHGISQIIAYGEELPHFDFRCPLLSLPMIFDTSLESIPSSVAYISADPMSLLKWQAKVQYDDSRFKVGLVWSGSPANIQGRYRSCSLDTFAPITEIENVSFYSLQKGPASVLTESLPNGIRLIDYTDSIEDFSDTAALIANLDLIISIDTAVAHLAGAMGKPVWTLIPWKPDWRWMLDREYSPWYPTMRLFRQPSPGDWTSVIKKVSQELQNLVLYKA